MTLSFFLHAWTGALAGALGTSLAGGIAVILLEARAQARARDLAAQVKLVQARAAALDTRARAMCSDPGPPAPPAPAPGTTAPVTPGPWDTSRPGRAHDLDPDQDLAYCLVCHGAEASLPTDCPGRPLLSPESQRIVEGALDYAGGTWLLKNTRGLVLRLAADRVLRGCPPGAVDPWPRARSSRPSPRAIAGDTAVLVLFPADEWTPFPPEDPS